jgi:hypothetical protein
MAASRCWNRRGEAYPLYFIRNEAQQLLAWFYDCHALDIPEKMGPFWEVVKVLTTPDNCLMDASDTHHDVFAQCYVQMLRKVKLKIE